MSHVAPTHFEIESQGQPVGSQRYACGGQHGFKAAAATTNYKKARTAGKKVPKGMDWSGTSETTRRS